ncbi:hypothetical protein B0H21DRAFT_567129 [Amylocystis lapponica]|nr:hypothetical protein B0H21DRAFT_567129 [Amylocystis lapponica]
MSTSRAESQTPQFGGRRRSNTAQSIYKNAPLSATPLSVGDSRALTMWVHDPRESPNVALNHDRWPGVVEGDMIRLSISPNDTASDFLFIVQRDEGFLKHQLQVSVPRPVAEKFGLRNNGEVTLTKIDKAKYCAEFVELTFQDQYLGRNEMWRLSSHLVGQCVYLEQEISFIGVIAAKVQAIYIGGKKVSAAYVTSSTKAIYRSLSAKVTIFIQVCRELWEFAGDGERYNEKIVHSFLPTLFNKWREANTNHIVTIVLISRVFYDASEIDYAAGPLREDDEGRWYKDFFKVITDLEVLYDWKPTLVGLKDSFWAFQRDILLAHHYHRSSVSSRTPPQADQVRLVGRLSFAHDGPVLEALNLGLNPTETHYVDRSLSLTGSSTLIITPGTGYFRVSKQLLRLTTTRILDQGFAADLVSLAKAPLHQSPIFCFCGYEPEVRMEAGGKVDLRSLDPLWGGDEEPSDGTAREKTTMWWEPFWLSVSFWDRHMDLPFREDRFVARVKMHEVEMLGLLDHDVLSSIEIPFLPDAASAADLSANPAESNVTKSRVLSQAEADQFDEDIFVAKQDSRGLPTGRSSLISSGSGPAFSTNLRLNDSLKRSLSSRTSGAPRVPLIEEQSPLLANHDLPPDGSSSDPDNKFLAATIDMLSTSPSQSSIRSGGSGRSQQSVVSVVSSTVSQSRARRVSAPQGSTKTKFTSSWLFSPFRSGLSQPQTSPVSASATPSPTDKSGGSSTSLQSTPSTPVVASRSTPRIPQPVTIRPPPSSRSKRPPTVDEDTLVSHRSSVSRYSPMNTPPRDETVFGKRRSATINSSATISHMPPSPTLRINPCKPLPSVPYTLSSLARRWQHIFPQPLSKHDIKWKSMIIPGCLPLTVEHFPTMSELETAYDVSPYDFVVDPPEMRSFLMKPPITIGSRDEVRRAWALAVMRGMVAMRLAQGFQFVLRAKDAPPAPEGHNVLQRTKSYVEDDMIPRPEGAAEVLRSANDPVYLSMSNEIHRIAYSGDSIQVRRYVRRMPKTQPFEYQCLIWPKLGVGYTELRTSFVSHGLENYGWNRLDMLVAGYENQFNDSLRYWRTRFVVIPTDEPPLTQNGPTGEKLDDEEVRLLGIDKLADLFSRARWQPPEDRGKPVPPVRFLPTDLDPAACVLDESLTAQLDEIHAAGPLRKKMKSERVISDQSLASIAKAMREEDGVPIKEHRWHGNKYPNSFTGTDFVSWLVREFQDVSTREQGTEWGIKLHEQGLFDHCRGAHGFLDGHYFYALKGEYLVPMTPRGGWFRATRHVPEEANTRGGQLSSGTPKWSGRRTKRRLILSQSMVIDIDPIKRSDQAESVVLHHDIIHNPATCFHFELQWIGTTARYIDDVLRQWNRTIERYGLKLVEAYVTQISDIRERNPFQSCLPIPLAVPPPVIPDFEKRLPDGVQTRHYFEYALLRKLGFVLDIEAADQYSDQVDVIYSYRRSPFKYSQWVHRSGVAFVQVLGDLQGFLFLTNRLMAPGRIGTALKYQRPAAAADEIRIKLQQTCSDPQALNKFYADELTQLMDQHALEEPPPLRI